MKGELKTENLAPETLWASVFNINGDEFDDAIFISQLGTSSKCEPQKPCGEVSIVLGGKEFRDRLSVRKTATPGYRTQGKAIVVRSGDEKRQELLIPGWDQGGVVRYANISTESLGPTLSVPSQRSPEQLAYTGQGPTADVLVLNLDRSVELLSVDDAGAPFLLVKVVKPTGELSELTASIKRIIPLVNKNNAEFAVWDQDLGVVMAHLDGDLLRYDRVLLRPTDFPSEPISVLAADPTRSGESWIYAVVAGAPGTYPPTYDIYRWKNLVSGTPAAVHAPSGEMMYAGYGGLPDRVSIGDFDGDGYEDLVDVQGDNVTGRVVLLKPREPSANPQHGDLTPM